MAVLIRQDNEQNNEHDNKPPCALSKFFDCACARERPVPDRAGETERRNLMKSAARKIRRAYISDGRIPRQ